MSFETWERVKLGKIASIIDCPHSTPKWTDSGYPVIRNWNVRGGQLSFEKASYTDKQTYLERIRRSKPELGDLVLTREAPMGEVCLIPDGLDCCLGQRVVLLKPSRRDVNPHFLLYSIQSGFVRNQILSHEGTGSTVSNLRIPAIANLDIPLPDLPTQQRIAAILSAFDDKIALNRQMNQTLEEMARAVFREWFVNFNYPGADGVQEDGLPEGWRIKRIEDISTLNRNTVTKNDAFEWIDYVEISEVNRGKIGNIVRYVPGEEPSRAKRKIRHGDTVLSTVRPNRGAYFLAMQPASTTIVSTGFAVFTPVTVPYSFLYLYLTDDERLDYYGHVADGGAYPAINPKLIAQLTLPIPNGSVLDAFQTVVGPMLQQIDRNEEQSRTLATLRDGLLPKLMKGEISVHSLPDTVSVC